MSDNYNTIIDQDWDELALDDGTIVDEFGSYSARIYPRDGTGESTLDSQAENISYSPEVNSAKGISVDVEPLNALEGEDYLGGILDVFVNNRPLFSGKIYKISTSSEEGTFYTLEAEPPAKELRNETINDSTDDFLLSDYVAKTVDKFNEYDDEHFNLIDTTDESLTDIDKVDRGREATSDSATATYSNVGSDASNIDILYVKLLVDGSVDVTIDTANSSYSETFTSSEGTYGDWFKIEPSGLETETYDIQYSLDGGSIVYDWIVLTESKITRTLEAEVGEKSLDESTVQYGDTNSSFEFIFEDRIVGGEDEEKRILKKGSDEEELPLAIRNGKIEQLQTAWVAEGEDAGDQEGESNTEFSGGESGNSGSTVDDFNWEISPDYTIPEGELFVAIRGRRKASDSNPVTYDVNLDFEELRQGEPIPSPGTDLEWQVLDDLSNNAIEPGTYNVKLDGQGEPLGPADDNSIDVVVAGDKRFYDLSTEPPFDNQVNEDNGYLDGPREMATIKLEFPEISVGESLIKGYMDIDTNRPSGAFELSISFGSEDFVSKLDTSSFIRDNNLITASIKSRLGFRGWEENGARDQTPRLGYTPQEISLYDLSVDTNDIEILFDYDASGNRLKTITNIIDNSRLYYRVEGSDIRLFRRGDKKTNVDLRKEDINSSVSIEDVYASCEVIGDGVTSGVIEADNAPDYVNRHKEIRDPDITNKDDATRRARSFLEEHSDIEYEGDITTLPTLAPLGEKIDGSIFGHGKDSFIESVRYGKRRTTIDVGRTKDLQSELLDLDRGVGSSRTRDTRV